MALYCYIKKSPSPPKIKKNLRFLSLGLIFIGVAFLANAALPIIFYQIRSYNFQPALISPVESYFIDYTNLDNWFLESPRISVLPSKITHYNLTVPRLKIEQAVVQVGGEDLSESLIHYPGTALPGQYGNAVIFGHSVLPQFYNPKVYKTIFSTLPTLKKGDEILIDFDGINYRYLVTQIAEVPPSDISILEQRYDGEYLTLVTCVPPGTYLKRLIVRAKLASFP
jgi:sortase A